MLTCYWWTPIVFRGLPSHRTPITSHHWDQRSIWRIWDVCKQYKCNVKDSRHKQKCTQPVLWSLDWQIPNMRSYLQPWFWRCPWPRQPHSAGRSCSSQSPPSPWLQLSDWSGRHTFQHGHDDQTQEWPGTEKDKKLPLEVGTIIWEANVRWWKPFLAMVDFYLFYFYVHADCILSWLICSSCSPHYICVGRVVWSSLVHLSNVSSKDEVIMKAWMITSRQKLTLSPFIHTTLGAGSPLMGTSKRSLFPATIVTVLSGMFKPSKCTFGGSAENEIKFRNIFVLFLILC